MATQPFKITKDAWVDLGVAPCFIQVRSGSIVFVIESQAPAADKPNSDCFMLGAGFDKISDIGLSGHIYARSVTPSSTVVVAR